jgi:hypothetical protein
MQQRRGRPRIWLVSILVAVFVLVGATSVFAANTVTETLDGGTRTASIADLVLGNVNYSHVNQTSSGTMALSVDDSTGSGDGWNVTVQSSDFVYSGSNDGTDIPAANFSITTSDAPTRVAGQAIDVDNGPKVPVAGSTGTLDQARKVIQADASYGSGTYGQDLDVSLVVPGLSRVGTYTGTLVVTISAGP